MEQVLDSTLAFVQMLSIAVSYYRGTNLQTRFRCPLNGDHKFCFHRKNLAKIVNVYYKTPSRYLSTDGVVSEELICYLHPWVVLASGHQSRESANREAQAYGH